MPSPGVGIRHYAPRARVVLMEGTEAELLRVVEEQRGVRTGVLLPRGWDVGVAEASGSAGQLAGISACATEVFAWGAWDAPGELAATLYAGLRALDERGVDVIVCPLPQGEGMMRAIRDRLLKAAKG